MTRIKKGGRELVVADTDVGDYLKQGYAVIDEKGNELTKPKAVTYAQAMRENVELKVKVKSLTAALEATNSQIVFLNQHIKSIDAAVDEATAGEKAEEKPVKAAAPQTPAAKTTVTTPHNLKTNVKRRSPSTTKPKAKAPQIAS